MYIIRAESSSDTVHNMWFEMLDKHIEMDIMILLGGCVCEAAVSASLPAERVGQ